MRRGKTHHNVQQVPMFMPPTDWEAPTGFPNLSNEKILFIDCESNDPNLMDNGPGFIRGDAELVGISVATVKRDSWYFPIAHGAGRNLDKGAVISWLTDLLALDSIKVFHNAQYDVEALDSENIICNGPWVCTMVTDALIYELSHSYKLNAVADRRAPGEAKDETLLIEAAAAMGVDPKGGLWRMPAEYVGPYAEQDASILVPIHKKQLDLIRIGELGDVFEMECKLLKVVWAMRKKGVKVDREATERLKAQWDLRRSDLLLDIDLDIWSPDDLQHYCTRNSIEFPTTPKGAPSFEAAWLAGHNNDKLNKIALARKYDKNIRDFLQGMLLDNLVGDRVHAQFHTTRRDDYGTRSGRFSSSNPNLQQVPSRDPLFGPAIRSLFVPDSGGTWTKFDYSSQEPRLTVHFAGIYNCTGSQEVISRYQRDKRFDFHKYSGDVVGTDRNTAKGVGLGITYGMGVGKLAGELGITLERAKGIMFQYRQGMPLIPEIANVYEKIARRDGHVRTLMGRCCHLDNPDHYYKALNRAIQGSGADMIKKAMVDIYEEFDVAPLLTVHDELNYTEYDEEFRWQVVDMMEQTLPTTVPALVEPENGSSWGELNNV